MYSAITYILVFILTGVALYFLPVNWFWTPLKAMGINPATDFTNPTIELIAMITLFGLTLVILTRQSENFRKIKTGEAKKMKIWKVFVGKFGEVLK